MRTRTYILIGAMIGLWFQAIALSNAGHGSACGSASYLYALGLPTMAEWSTFFVNLF